MSKRPPQGQNAPRRPPAPQAPAPPPPETVRVPARPVARPVQPNRQAQPQRGAQPQRSAQPQRQGRTNVAARRGPPPRSNDRLPWIIAGVLGIVIVLLLGVFIATNNNGGTGTAVPTAVANNPVDPNKQLTVSSAEAPPTSATDPPRMSLDAFKKLYDDPTQRPLIIDVRAAESYAAGHIKGAISFPESDVDARIKELPKDKLIVAYCQ